MQAPAIAFAPDPGVAAWIEAQVATEKLALQIAASLGEVIHALIEGSPPRPMLLIADFDAIPAGELPRLRTIREHGWFGTIIALGTVPFELRQKLNVQRVLERPFSGDPLRDAVRSIGLLRPTTKMTPL
jgi:hypothetical protein